MAAHGAVLDAEAVEELEVREVVDVVEARRAYHAFGLIWTVLSKKISVFQSSSLKVVRISPNAS
jgi:hypothetical protein